jgi:glycosyltransferase involved in cell wall biosynthesis
MGMPENSKSFNVAFPKLSVITINLNNSLGLTKTIKSVFSQSFTDYEYLVIDGGSNDGSVEIIREFEDRISYWLSEPDSGIYNAMNKGIKAAKGEWILFLNSGDFFCSKESLQLLLQEAVNEDIVYGDLIKINSDGTKRYRSYPDDVTIQYISKNALPHQAMIIKSKLFINYGLYKEHYKIVADWEFYTRVIFKHNVKYKHVPVPVAVFDTSGISNNPKLNKLHEEEKMQAKLSIYDRNVWYLAEAYLELENKHLGLITSGTVKFALKISKFLRIFNAN